MEGEDSRSFRPTMLSFKAFLATQDDSITDDEAIDKYAEYKVEFSRQQLNEFFVAHKEEEWFREKYHPELQQDRNNQALSCIKNRFQLFMELYNNGNLKELRLEEDSFQLQKDGGVRPVGDLTIAALRAYWSKTPPKPTTTFRISLGI